MMCVAFDCQKICWIFLRREDTASMLRTQYILTPILCYFLCYYVYSETANISMTSSVVFYSFVSLTEWGHDVTNVARSKTGSSGLAFAFLIDRNLVFLRLWYDCGSHHGSLTEWGHDVTNVARSKTGSSGLAFVFNRQKLGFSTIVIWLWWRLWIHHGFFESLR